MIYQVREETTGLPTKIAQDGFIEGRIISALI